MIKFRKLVFQWLEKTFQAAHATGSVKAKAKPSVEAVTLLALVEGAQIAARVTGKREAFDVGVGHSGY